MKNETLINLGIPIQEYHEETMTPRDTLQHYVKTQEYRDKVYKTKQNITAGYIIGILLPILIGVIISVLYNIIAGILIAAFSAPVTVILGAVIAVVNEEKNIHNIKKDIENVTGETVTEDPVQIAERRARESVLLGAAALSSAKASKGYFDGWVHKDTTI